MTLLRVAARGFLIVALVSWNTRHIAALAYGPSFLTGCAISLVWWGNSHTAAHAKVPGARWAYALGAGIGTLFGMWLGR